MFAEKTLYAPRLLNSLRCLFKRLRLAVESVCDSSCSNFLLVWASLELCISDIQQIKIDTEDYYSEYLGFDTTPFIPKDVESYTHQQRTYYRLKENCDEKLKKSYEPAAISWANLRINNCNAWC